ncbi:GNAT family N-acetyltransferase [Actinoplanes solisilvae]|uniref:GNAT family N-acetyltransferase n=1 Tax=Actinoplanes solisilvae TaxID=2486853 RepID=UPI000FDBF920|nr:GNAT family N-acetyltransferase [Actinoplanes solisilvae]
MTVTFVVRFPVDDAVLNDLHGRAFGSSGPVVPWRARLERHALTWVGAFAASRLIGFVQVGWDGGSHAFLLDTAVDPAFQGNGIGAALVKAAVDEARAAGCTWAHVDFEPRLEDFYLRRCGFRPTAAGLIALDAENVRG